VAKRFYSGIFTEAGYEATSGEPLAGYEHVYVNDPFGNRLELLQAVNLKD